MGIDSKGLQYESDSYVTSYMICGWKFPKAKGRTIKVIKLHFHDAFHYVSTSDFR